MAKSVGLARILGGAKKVHLGFKPRFSDEELEELLKKLTAYAVLLFAQAGLTGSDVSLRGTGVSPQDLAIGTLDKLVCGELNYHRTKGRLDSYLATVMVHDFLDIVRSKAYTTSVASDSEDSETPAPDHPHHAQFDGSPSQPDLHSYVADREYKEKVYDLLEGERDLEEMAYAVLELDAIKPQDIAGLLKTDATDIQNRKKRMRRRLAEFLNRQADQ